jgi:UDP-N-acetylmuramyl pentapeptide phosphotransferase/UDP-N-acetylglucosamine-1-phosphate transferase
MLALAGKARAVLEQPGEKMSYFVLSLLASFLIALWIISNVKRDDHWASDTTLHGAQKFHTKPVPRVGGVPIFTALAVATLMMWWQGTIELRNGAAILLCAAPAFAVGLIEDFTKKVQPASRMIAVCLSALLSWAILDVQISRVDIPWIDAALKFAFPAMLLTVFAVAGIANAINIIDGFHGLALMMFIAIGFVAHLTDDALVLTLAFASAGALLGVFAWNYPKGRIFLGDGGAYLVGFMLAQCGILLFHRNPEVSPWFAVLVLGYPTVETLFSAYRKKLLRKISPMHPDRAHLHMLVFGRVVPRYTDQGIRIRTNTRNARTSPYLWAMTLTTLVPAVVFYDNSRALMLVLAAFSVLYVVIYVRLVRFKPLHLPFGRTAHRVKQLA